MKKIILFGAALTTFCLSTLNSNVETLAATKVVISTNSMNVSGSVKHINNWQKSVLPPDGGGTSGSGFIYNGKYHSWPYY